MSFLQSMIDNKLSLFEVTVRTMCPDGKPLVVRCRELSPMEWFKTKVGRQDRGSLPLQGSQPKHRDEPEESMTDQEVIENYEWMKRVVALSVVAITDVESDGTRIWRQVHFDTEPVGIQEDGSINLPMDAFDRTGNVRTVIDAVINHSNFGGGMEDSANASFPQERSNNVRDDGGTLRSNATRDLPWGTGRIVSDTGWDSSMSDTNSTTSIQYSSNPISITGKNKEVI